MTVNNGLTVIIRVVAFAHCFDIFFNPHSIFFLFFDALLSCTIHETGQNMLVEYLHNFYEVTVYCKWPLFCVASPTLFYTLVFTPIKYTSTCSVVAVALDQLHLLIMMVI